MKIKFFLLYGAVGLWSMFFPTILIAQTLKDSLTLQMAQWEVKDNGKGIVSKCAAFHSLYDGAQYVSVVEVSPKGRYEAGLAVSRQMTPISRLAHQYGAVAAINGSYFNMKKGNSVCFLQKDGEVIDTTTSNEFNIRVTGAIVIHKGRISIQPWTKRMERNYKKRKNTVLASGPLLLQNGMPADWTMCSHSFVNNKHPRSAIAVTKDKKVLLVTVDGRSLGNAVGVNIPELAQLMKVLGAKTALNLDGGGSTTLYFNGEILNHPTDNRKFDHEGERGIPNMIYFK